jgi:hypothetical protein
MLQQSMVGASEATSSHSAMIIRGVLALPNQSVVYYPKDLSLLGEVLGSERAVIAAELADASQSGGGRKKHSGLCSDRTQSDLAWRG